MILDVWISKRQIFECEDFLASHRGLIGEPLENLQYGLRLDLVSPSSSFSSIAALMSLFSSSNIILRSTWRAKVTHLSNTNCLISFTFQINCQILMSHLSALITRVDPALEPCWSHIHRRVCLAEQILFRCLTNPILRIFKVWDLLDN